MKPPKYREELAFLTATGIELARVLNEESRRWEHLLGPICGTPFEPAMEPLHRFDAALKFAEKALL